MEVRTEPESYAAPDLNLEVRKFLREHWPSAAAKAKAAAAGAGAIAALNSQASAAAPAPSGGDFDPLLVRLVNRVCGGFVYSEYQLAVQLGFTGYRDYHLNHLAIPDPEVASKLPLLALGNEILTSTPQQMYQAGGTAPFRQAFRALTATRAVLTKRMLFERMAEFWTDHLNIYLETIEEMAYLKPYDDRRVVRPDALGKFKRMLAGDGTPSFEGSAKSPAMLIYLDNYLNSCVGGGLPSNENYGRELLELHTLSTAAGYLEDDVKNAAACFTGWTTPRYSTHPNFGNFVYDGTVHCGGAVNVFGIPVPAGGQSQGKILLDALVAHPATKQFISKKLISWLLRYDTDAGPTEVAFAAYGSDGDVQAMIQAILTPATIEKVEADGATKVKRPYELAVNLLRSLPTILDFATGVTIPPLLGAVPLAGLTEKELPALSNAPYAWAPPDGYPDSASAWTSNMLGRWELPWKILTHQVPGIFFSEDDLTNFVLSLGPLGPGGFGQRMNQLLTGGCMSTVEAQLVDAFFVYGAAPAQNWKLNDILRGGIALAASTPTYQTC